MQETMQGNMQDNLLKSENPENTEIQTILPYKLAKNIFAEYFNSAEDIKNTLVQNIFKAYDIRGRVPDELDAKTAVQIGLAIASELISLGQKRIAIGYDGRESNQMLANALTVGLVFAGIEVVNLGLVTTPMTYFAGFHPYLQLNSCVMITGSHNPPEYNGFKMVINGKTIYKEHVQALKNRILEQDFLSIQADDLLNQTSIKTLTQTLIQKQVVDYNIYEAYATQVQARAPQTAKLKIAVDCGNGVTGAHNIKLLEALGHDVIALFQEVDGSFPNHHPDPAQPENLKDLIAAVKQHHCDVGLAFDGDGDRLGLVTSEGEIIYADRQIMLFVQEVLQNHPQKPILFDVKCSSFLAPLIKSLGGIPVMYQTGHSLIKAKMKELGAPFAGEMSGHIFFADQWFGFDDALYTAARLLAILGQVKNQGQSISKVLNDLPQAYSTPELHIDCLDAHAKIEKLKNLIAAKIITLQNTQLSTIDGVRVDYHGLDQNQQMRQGFALVRASNTTPILVLRFEAQSPEMLAILQAEWMAYLQDL